LFIKDLPEDRERCALQFEFIGMNFVCDRAKTGL